MDDATIAKLKELAGLKDAGVLSEEEFQAQKKALLSSGAVPAGYPVQGHPMQVNA